MRIVVTGHMGFIGGHVMRRLEGHSVLGVDRKAGIPIVELSPKHFKNADAVIHLAAHADVRLNWSGGLGPLWENNVEATRWLLEACAVGGLRSDARFVFISTGAVYAPSMSPYAASKITGEAWCQAYADKYGWKLTIARPAACFGSGYHHGHVADFVAQARALDKLAPLSAGLPRDAVHVEDCADWLVKFATEDGHEGIKYVASRERWGARDTAQAMGIFDTEWPDNDLGWLGDTGHRLVKGPSVGCERPIGDGVRDALRTLGWEVKR